MLREILARFGIQFDGAPAKRAEGMIAKLKVGLQGLVAAFGAGVLVSAIRSFVVEMTNLGDETAKTARQMGISGRQLQAFRFAAERSGVDAGSLTNGIRRLQRNIVDASEGVDTAIRAFTDLGVSVHDADGNVREIQDILPEIADGFIGLQTATQRSARAQQLFGRSGAQLLPFFEGGSQGIRELTERFEELGGGMSEEFLANAEASQDALSDWNLAMVGLKATIAQSLLPSFTRFVNGIAELVADIRRVTEGTELWRAMLVTLGVIAAALALKLIIAFSPIILTVLAIAAGFAAVVLIVEDFLSYMKGAPSITGNVVSVVTRAFQIAVEIWKEIFSDAAAAIGGFFTGVWETITSGLNNVVQRVQNAIASVRSAVASAAGFLGIDVGGGGPAARPGPAARVRAPGGGGATIQQQNNVTIQGVDMANTAEIERRVQRAQAEANARALRDADRALSPVAG